MDGGDSGAGAASAPRVAGSGWRAIGASVRGASHVRAGLPNQDAIRWWPGSGAGPPLTLAVSDGHGGKRYFRSDVGAHLAVAAGTAVVASLQDLARSPDESGSLSLVKRMAEEQLPQALVRAWVQDVEEHRAQAPLSAAELDALEQADGPASRQAVEADPLLAYGATVLVVLVSESFIVYLQLGDGDILTVSETGEVGRPLPADERLFANATTSLCARDAWRNCRVRFQAIAGPPGAAPALILLSTDGYANSFRDDDAFRKVGSDLREMIGADGLEAVGEDMVAWLNEASQAGSGDDVTLGILCRPGAFPAGAAQPDAIVNQAVAARPEETE